MVSDAQVRLLRRKMSEDKQKQEAEKQQQKDYEDYLAGLSVE